MYVKFDYPIEYYKAKMKSNDIIDTMCLKDKAIEMFGEFKHKDNIVTSKAKEKLVKFQEFETKYNYYINNPYQNESGTAISDYFIKEMIKHWIGGK